MVDLLVLLVLVPVGVGGGRAATGEYGFTPSTKIAFLPLFFGIFS